MSKKPPFLLSDAIKAEVVDRIANSRQAKAYRFFNVNASVASSPSLVVKDGIDTEHSRITLTGSLGDPAQANPKVFYVVRDVARILGEPHPDACASLLVTDLLYLLEVFFRKEGITIK